MEEYEMHLLPFRDTVVEYECILDLQINKQIYTQTQCSPLQKIAGLRLDKLETTTTNKDKERSSFQVFRMLYFNKLIFSSRR
jgi:hypothetical protein